MRELIRTGLLQAQRFTGAQPGPRLIVTGAVHGNETCGPRAIERVLGEIARGELPIVRGSVTFVPVCNPLAYARGSRVGERNLNRRLLPTATPQDHEDRIANELCPLLAAHEVLLDLHSFRGPGLPFVLRGPADNSGTLEPFAHAADEARLAAHLGPRRIVDGWMTAYAAGVTRRRARAPEALQQDLRWGIGTTEYLRSQGGFSLTLECGQHADPAAPEVARHAIHQTLALLGLSGRAPAPPAGPFECLQLAEVVDRHAAGDHFARRWTSFDTLAAGELIALRADGRELRASGPGWIVFPDAAALPGQEWFYLARRSDRTIDGTTDRTIAV